MLTGRVNAPEINTRHGWLNTDRAYTLKEFRGKIVLLDFWTFGCINCQHILPDLKRLEKEYAQELVVIGVHSAKFDAEKQQHAIRRAILKFGIEHPVVNDADFEVWKQYAINAWPTVVLIDPEGKVVGQKPSASVTTRQIGSTTANSVHRERMDRAYHSARRWLFVAMDT